MAKAYIRQLVIVENALDDDENSIARLSSHTMNKLELFCGDAVKLKGKKRRRTVCIVLVDDSCPDDHIRINAVVQKNLRVHSGVTVSIEGYQPIKYGTRIHVLPFDNTVNDRSDDLLSGILQSYFRDAFRPVYVGDTFTVRTVESVVEFKVIETEPSPYCIVTSDTTIDCYGEPIQRWTEEILHNEIDFDDIGGLEEMKRELKEVVLMMMDHDRIYTPFEKFGMAPSRGLFVYGPAGCGKTMLIRALANECDIDLVSIKRLELLSVSFDDTESMLRNAFDRARQTAPCIVLIDELDYLFEAAEQSVTRENNLAERLINQLLTEIDGMYWKTKVLIAAVTNRPQMIDKIFLRPGRFDQMVYVPVPDETSRQAILKLALEKCPLAPDVDLITLAKCLAGCSGSTVVKICQRACKAAIRESIEQSAKQDLIDSSTNVEVQIRQDHFDQALKLAPRYILSSDNLRQYETFGQMWHLLYRNDFLFPILSHNGNSSQDGAGKQDSHIYTDDGDLYG